MSTFSLKLRKLMNYTMQLYSHSYTGLYDTMLKKSIFRNIKANIKI